MAIPLVDGHGNTIPQYSGEFCRVIIGSTIHGLSVADTDDLDLMGVRIERPEERINLHKPFEQHTWRSQPEGYPSGKGDVDSTVYSLTKFMKLVANGNPTLLNLLFVAPESRHIDGAVANELRGLIPAIVSREAAGRYLGYLSAQRRRLLGEQGQKRTGSTRRLKYLSEGGWDTKYGMHMIRLGLQGIELLETGKITLPMPEPNRTEVMKVRLGEIEMDEVIGWARGLEARLAELRDTADLPAHPNRDLIQRWMIEQYLGAWEGYL